MKKIPSVFLRKKRKLTEKKVIGFWQKTANFLDVFPLIRIWVRLNQSATILAFCVALIGFLLALQKYDDDNKRSSEDRIAKSWDVLTRMSGKNANGGQVEAIERLNSYSIPLDMVDLHDTYLAKVNLKGASLRGANLRGAILTKANLQGADLTGADLHGAVLIKANLGGAQLDNTDLSNAKLFLARINISAVLARDLTEADLTSVTFVYEDENGEDMWEMYGDTIAESPEADNAQKKINSACGNRKYNVLQSNAIPITLPTRPCRNAIDYTLFQWWESTGYPSDLTGRSSSGRK